MSLNGAIANTVTDSASFQQHRPTISTAVSTNLQTLSANHLQVPTQSHSAVIRTPSAAFSSISTSSYHFPLSTSTGSITRPLSSAHPNMQPSYYTGTTSQRMSDLRKILNPEVEKEDSFKKFTEAIENCDCFEFNLNNAAKLITVLVLLATLVLVIRALKGDG